MRPINIITFAAAIISSQKRTFSESFEATRISHDVKTSKFSARARLQETKLFMSVNTNERPDKMAYNTIMRYELKKEILESADLFKVMQEEMLKMKDMEADDRKKKRKGMRKQGLFRRRLGNENHKTNEEDELLNTQSIKMKGLLGSSSFTTAMVTLGDKGEEIIEIAEKLARLNPTPIPTYGWQGYKGGNPENDCLLEGIWKLRFTTAADATFRESPTRGKAITFQDIDSTAGILTNVIDFEKGNVEGFRVFVEGKAESDDEMALTFKRIIINRRKKFLFFFKTIKIPLPSFKFLRAFAKTASMGRAQAKKAGFKILYIDDEFRMHKTNDGNWFIQTKVKDDW